MNAFEVLGYLVESFIPTDSLPTLRSAADRIFQAVFIVVKISERSSLRANVAAAEGIVFVTADIEALVARGCDLDPADRFAEIAIAIMDQIIHGASEFRLV